VPLRSHIRKAALALVLSALVPAAFGEVVVVVSSTSPVAPLTSAQVADIFLGRASYFPSGEETIPLDLPEDSPARTEFYRECTGKSTPQLRAYWSKLIFTGRAQPPREVANAEAVKRYLQTRPNAIAYIERKDVDASLKVVLSLRP
jgi:ABC-type phosphate transport system substrate-binding protein